MKQLLKITAALSIFLSPVIRTSNCRRDGGAVLLIIVVSLSIFTTFLLGILLEKIVFLHFLCQHWITTYSIIRMGRTSSISVFGMGSATGGFYGVISQRCGRLIRLFL